MEPATLLLALTTAIAVALKEKAGGAAAEGVLEAAQYQAKRLAGIIRDRKEKDFAEEVVRHVLAESAAFPPDRAVRVVPLVAPNGAGIHPPDTRLVLELLWINHADFPVRVRNVVVTGRVGSGTHEYETKAGDEITLPARGEYTQKIIATLRAGIAVPVFDSGRANCDVAVSALVAGPWLDEPQKTREVFSGAAMLPVLVEPEGLLTDLVDVRLTLDSWFIAQYRSHYNQPATINLLHLERDMKLAPGTARQVIEGIARKYGYEPELGTLTVQITPRPAEDQPRNKPLFSR